MNAGDKEDGREESTSTKGVSDDPRDRDSARRPAWVPEGDKEGFTTKIMSGVEGGHDGLPGPRTRGRSPRKRPSSRRHLSVDDTVAGILDGDRTILGQAITLIESTASEHASQAQELLLRLLPHTRKSVRVGITGVPGVGKSSFIEALGLHLITHGHRVAVLAVDPSSEKSRGSILGDKTRMAELAKREEAFIRPSPTRGDLGGVARKTRETIVLVEAFGCDVVLVETVGVGQSETTVRSMVDFFMLLMLAGAGDELQGIKRGVTELADALVITKADGENVHAAEAAGAEYTRALRYLAPATKGWQTRAHTVSALAKRGVDEVWRVVERFLEIGRASDVFEARRQSQRVAWTLAMAEQDIKERFYRTAEVADALPKIQDQVARGEVTAAVAARTLLDAFYGALRARRPKS